MSTSKDSCDLAVARHEQFARWAQLWQILVYALGTALALLLIATVIFGVFSNWTSGAITLAGSVASGVGTKWLVAQRNTAVEDERAAYEKVVEVCGDTKGADELRRRLKLG